MREPPRAAYSPLPLLAGQYYVYYSYRMLTIEQMVDIPANRHLRLDLDLPDSVSAGRTPVTLIVPDTPSGQDLDLELINRHADRLNREALDVLSYQQLDL